MKLRYDDQQHGYWLDGKRCKGVTSVAKIPDDLFRLQQWSQRQVAIGLASSPDLVQAVAAHADDWKLLNNLCDKAKEVAGANRGATRGTAAHTITENHDLGKDVIKTELAVSILAQWKLVLAAAGLTVVPGWIERIVVFPEQRICGTFDRICIQGDNAVMVDLKSGENAIKYPHAIAIQLAMYANAPLMAGSLNAKGETTEFEPMPPIRKDYGMVIHIPEVGKASAVKVDIEQGWKAAQEICFPTIKWRGVRAEDLVSGL